MRAIELEMEAIKALQLEMEAIKVIRNGVEEWIDPWTVLEIILAYLYINEEELHLTRKEIEAGIPEEGAPVRIGLFIDDESVRVAVMANDEGEE